MMMELIEAKKERTGVLREIFTQNKNENKNSIEKQCEVFAMSILLLPQHLQMQCKRDLINLL